MLATAAAMPPTSAAAGKVSSQAYSILRAVDQRTSCRLRPMPEPTIAPEHTWVVDRPKPRWEEARMVTLAEVSAAKPCGACTSTMPLPIVRMIRQPPDKVPRPMARPEVRMTHVCGPVPAAWYPLVINTKVITPIVFCPSDVPWASATMDAEMVWPCLNPLVARLLRAPWVSL